MCLASIYLNPKEFIINISPLNQIGIGTFFLTPHLFSCHIHHTLIATFEQWLWLLAGESMMLFTLL